MLSSLFCPLFYHSDIISHRQRSYIADIVPPLDHNIRYEVPPFSNSSFTNNPFAWITFALLAILALAVLVIWYQTPAISKETHPLPSRSSMYEMLYGMARKLSIMSRNAEIQRQDADSELEAKLDRKKGAEMVLGLADRLKAARARDVPIPNELVKVMLDMESVLMKAIPQDKPVNHMRARAKQWAASLKLAAKLESPHISESVANVCLWSLMTMISAFLLSLLVYSGNDGPFDSWNPTSFFSPNDFSIFSYAQYLFLPFGWNLYSLIPYIMAISTITTVLSPIPCIGPSLTRIAYLVLLCRFLWHLRLSLLTMTLGLIVPLPYAIYGWRKQMPRLYVLIPCIIFSIFAGWFFSFFDPMMVVEYRREPLLATALRCVGYELSHYISY